MDPPRTSESTALLGRYHEEGLPRESIAEGMGQYVSTEVLGIRRNNLGSRLELEAHQQKMRRRLLAASIFVGHMTLWAIFFRFTQDWNWIESAYFVVVTVTTVGYGDYFPSDDWRPAHLLFIWISLTIVTFCIGILMENASESGLKLIDSSFTSRHHRVVVRILVSLCVLVLWMFIGAFTYRVLEGWSWLDSFYFTTVTAGTIGYGRVTPTNDLSRLVSIFYIFIAVISVGNCINSILAGIMALQELENRKRLYCTKLDISRLKAMDKSGDQSIDELEFVMFMLIKSDLACWRIAMQVEQDDIDEIRDFFAMHDSNNDGKIDISELQKGSKDLFRKIQDRRDNHGSGLRRGESTAAPPKPYRKL